MDGMQVVRGLQYLNYYYGESLVLMFSHSPLDGCIVQPIEVIFVKSVDGLSAVLLMAVHNQLCKRRNGSTTTIWMEKI